MTLFFFHFRFKENNVIDKELYSYNNTLEISDVAGLNGSFRCRVVNQFGSEFSEVAELKVMPVSILRPLLDKSATLK